MREKYKFHNIELERDGTYSVTHPCYRDHTGLLVMANRKSVEECKSYIDWKELEADKRVAMSMAYTMMERR